MATITLYRTFDMFVPPEVAFGAHVSHTTGDYTWSTSGSYNITALSGLEDIAVDGSSIPVSGTINAISAVDTGANAMVYSVLGLDTAITNLVDEISFDQMASFEEYWDTVLAGTTELHSDDDGDVFMTGDFSDVAGGLTRNGAADSGLAVYGCLRGDFRRRGRGWNR